MARTDTLPHFLTDVADAIRTKAGTSGTIQASSFDTAIANLPSGGNYNAKIDGSKTYNSNYGALNLITEIGEIDLTGKTTLENMFRGAMNLETITVTNTSSVTNVYNMFLYCYALTSINLFDTTKVTNMGSFFQDCSHLTTLPQFDTSKVTNLKYAFLRCGSLTNESLNNILAMCINATAYASTKTLKYIGLDSTQATACQSLSNYQAFLNAGWTTGY